MKRIDFQHLLAEATTLKSLLADIPEEDVIDRMSMEARIRGVEAAMASAHVDEREPAKAILTFRGRPVFGTRGILADFGSDAVRKFSDAVTAVAASLDGPLSPMGPIPNRGVNQLLITNTAIGSFGFELEEYRSELPLDALSPIEEALEHVHGVLSGTLGTDDELADTVVDTDPRALGLIRSFLQTMVDSEATCAFGLNGKTVRFADVAQVTVSLKRLSQENLVEKEEYLEGELLGVLPTRRTFEFQISGTGKIISGKVGSSFAEPRKLNDYLGRQSKIHLTVTTVGSGRPRYTLLGLQEEE
jgi:hypothetical protein